MVEVGREYIYIYIYIYNKKHLVSSHIVNKDKLAVQFAGVDLGFRGQGGGL